MKSNKFRIISSGGLGDLILSTPAIAELKRISPKRKIILYCRKKMDKAVYQNNPNIDRIVTRSFFRTPLVFAMYRFGWAKFHLFYYGSYLPSLYYKNNAAEMIGELLGVEVKGKKLEIFLTPQEDEQGIRRLAGYKSPIILHSTALFSENKNWATEKWVQLVKSMPDHTFVQLGSLNDALIEGTVDLRGRTSLRESMAIIRHAKSFVGVDSVLAHVTSAFDIPGVVLFGPSTADVWGHKNNINIYKRLHCSPCIDLLGKAACPYGKPCMNEISVEDVRNQLLQALNKR